MRFHYHGRELTGFVHEYNTTAQNERAVELAIAEQWLAEFGAGDGLEVGHVLGHYGWSGHRVVDLHERATGVENLDVFDVGGRFEWIVSISTIEHVGWDEDRLPGKAIAAIDHLRTLLLPGGAMLVTVPTGWNPALDQYLAQGADGASRACTIKRSGKAWRQTDRLSFPPYALTTPWAEAVWVGEWI